MAGILNDVAGLWNPEDPDAVVPVAAGELFAWSEVTGELACWLDRAAETTRFDHARFYDKERTTDQTVAELAHIRARIGVLLGGDRGQR